MFPQNRNYQHLQSFAFKKGNVPWNKGRKGDIPWNKGNKLFNRKQHESTVEFKQKRKEYRQIPEQIQHSKDYSKQYRQTDHYKKLKPIHDKKYRLKNKEILNKKQKKFYNKNKETIKQRSKEWSANNKDKVKQYGRRSARKLKELIMNYYSNGLNCCNYCGKDGLVFLTIDHINNNGNEERKVIGKNSFYQWLKNNHLPNGYQVLCWNCNAAKTIIGDEKLKKLLNETYTPLNILKPIGQYE